MKGKNQPLDSEVKKRVLIEEIRFLEELHKTFFKDYENKEKEINGSKRALAGPINPIDQEVSNN